MRNSQSFRRRRFSSQSRSKNTPASRMNYDSHGPNGVKVRGIANQVSERYVQYAREAASNDRILMEAYLQYAENYLRLARGDFDQAGGSLFKIRRFDERIDNPDGVLDRAEGDSSSEVSEEPVAETSASVDGDARNVQRRPRTRRLRHPAQIKRAGFAPREDKKPSEPDASSEAQPSNYSGVENEAI